ncbi:XrtA/PEP-CTERM system TPR-repeat protein PrsT [Roseomonas sp. WA12]
MRVSRRPQRSALLLAGVVAATLSAGAAFAQPLERARAAQARGDLRAAQIEYRNAVRAEPGNPATRLGLGGVSLELGDADTAEREARAALETGREAEAATSLLVRTYLARERFRELLRDLPLPRDRAQPGVAGQIAAGRALAEIALDERQAAGASLEEARRLMPEAVETRLVASALAQLEGRQAEAEAEIEAGLARHPDAPTLMFRKAVLQVERGDWRAALGVLDGLIERTPSYSQARLMRAELRMRADNPSGARQDVDAVLRATPGSAPATFLLAALHAQAREWQAADTVLQRLSRVLPNFQDGLLLLAAVKRELGARAQAEEAVQRHVARYPDDSRGPKQLAILLLDGGRAADAAALLARASQRFERDAEVFDLLGRAQAASGQARNASAAFQRAADLSPGDAGIRARLSASRLAVGDMAGTSEAAEQALRLAPGQEGARELLAMAALLRGEVTAAQAEWDRLDAAGRRAESGATLGGFLMLARFDLPAARTAFEAVIRDYPRAIGGRVGLARVAIAQGGPEEAERLLGEVLRLAPANPEALGLLGASASPGGPRAAAARAVLEAAHAAQPGERAIAIVLANSLINAREPARALAVLGREELQGPKGGPDLHLLRSTAYVTLERWEEAEASARLALSEEPRSLPVRQQLIALLLRAGKPQEAEAIAQEGLRLDPANASAQRMRLALAQRIGGLDAALATADRLAALPEARPSSLTLRGDLLLAAQKPEEAARAYKAAQATAPSSVLVLREAQALSAAGQTAQAVAALSAWSARQPDDVAVLEVLARYDITAGRDAEAERRLNVVLQRAPDNTVALNNLAWIVAKRGGAAEIARARQLSERAYFLMPNAETADTFGWVLARGGEAERAVVLLTQAVNAPRPQGQAADPSKSYRLAYALEAAGRKDEAVRALEPALAGGGAFPERAEAERLLARLRGGR